MNLVFYKSVDDPNKLGKNLGTPVHIATDIVAYEPVDDLNGVFKISYNSAIDGSNYCIYGDKKYFITDRTFGVAGMIIIGVIIDVLDTYQAAIENLNCIIKRTSADPEKNENGWNSLIEDQWAVTEVNTDEFEVALEDQSSFAYDPRPYLAVIGYDPPNGSMRGTVDNFPVFT